MADDGKTRETNSTESNFDTPIQDGNTSSAQSAPTKPSTRTTDAQKNLKLISTNYGFGGGARTANGTDSSRLTDEHRARWKARGIDPELAIRYGVHSRAKCVAFDYIQDGEVYNTKLRYGKGNMPWEHKKDPLIFWNVDCLEPDVAPDEFLIITEGEPDALSLLQIGFNRVVSLPNGAQVGDNGYKFLFVDSDDTILPGVEKFSDIVLALDADTKGRKATDRLIKILDTIRCRVVTYPEGCKDANDVLVQFGPDALRQCILCSTHQWRSEIRRLSDVPEPGPLIQYTAGIPGIDQHGFRLITPGIFSIIGPYGSGKSILLRQMLVHLWRTYGWRFLLTALEERVKWRYANHLTKLLSPKDVVSCTREEIAATHEEIDTACRFLTRPYRQLATPEWLINRIEIALKREDVRVVGIDPVNQIDHVLARGENYTDYMGRFLMDLQRLAEDYDVLIIVAAHPAKVGVDKRGMKRTLLTLNDASGTSHFGNKSDIGWCVWRPHWDGPTMLHIDKLKDEEHMGKRTVAKLYLTEATEKFTADVIGYRGFWQQGKVDDETSIN